MGRNPHKADRQGRVRERLVAEGALAAEDSRKAQQAREVEDHAKAEEPERAEDRAKVEEHRGAEGRARAAGNSNRQVK